MTWSWSWFAFGAVMACLALLYGRSERAAGLRRGRAQGHREGHLCQVRGERQDAARALAANPGNEDLQRMIEAIDHALWEEER